MPDFDLRPPAKRCRGNATPPCSYCTLVPEYCDSVVASPVNLPPTIRNKSPVLHEKQAIPPDLTPSTVTTPSNHPEEDKDDDVPILDLTPSTRATMLETTTPTSTPTPELPDEVLVAVLRFVRNAGVLWRLRSVCRRWCQVIDAHSSVWKDATFKGLQFTRRVVVRPKSKLGLGPRLGRAAIGHAARCGNEWAGFLQQCLFERGGAPLQALTVAQPAASRLVRGARSFDTREPPPAGWAVVHAARRGPADLPRGALVGVVRVRAATRLHAAWRWHLDRHVPLSKPLRCAGYVGLWPLSAHLTELLIRGLHSQ